MLAQISVPTSTAAWCISSRRASRRCGAGASSTLTDEDATAIARRHGIGTSAVVIINTTLLGAYARAMAEGAADINRCPPGGARIDCRNDNARREAVSAELGRLADSAGFGLMEMSRQRLRPRQVDGVARSGHRQDVEIEPLEQHRQNAEERLVVVDGENKWALGHIRLQHILPDAAGPRHASSGGKLQHPPGGAGVKLPGTPDHVVGHFTEGIAHLPGGEGAQIALG